MIEPTEDKLIEPTILYALDPTQCLHTDYYTYTNKDKMLEQTIADPTKFLLTDYFTYKLQKERPALQDHDLVMKVIFLSSYAHNWFLGINKTTLEQEIFVHDSQKKIIHPDGLPDHVSLFLQNIYDIYTEFSWETLKNMIDCEFIESIAYNKTANLYFYCKQIQTLLYNKQDGCTNFFYSSSNAGLSQDMSLSKYNNKLANNESQWSNSLLSKEAILKVFTVFGLD